MCNRLFTTRGRRCEFSYVMQKWLQALSGSEPMETAYQIEGTLFLVIGMDTIRKTDHILTDKRQLS